MPREITLPYLQLNGDDDQKFAAGLFASDDQRWKLVEQLLETSNLSLDDVPEAWRVSPLVIWCWLVLELNEIEYDREVQRPLVSYGIDMGFAPSPVRQFVWLLA